MTINFCFSGLVLRDKKAHCGYAMLETSIPDIFLVMEENRLDVEKLTGADVNHFTQATSSFQHSILNHKLTTREMYQQILEGDCNQSKMILETFRYLAIAGYGYGLHGKIEPGIQVVSAGAVAYVYKCPQIKVTLREPTECYEVHLKKK